MKFKKWTVPISSLSNLNIRIVDRVIIQWVRSTYFFFGWFLNFTMDLVGIMENRNIWWFKKLLYHYSEFIFFLSIYLLNKWYTLWQLNTLISIRITSYPVSYYYKKILDWIFIKPLIGFEPMTYALPWRYSTTELKGQLDSIIEGVTRRIR